MHNDINMIVGASLCCCDSSINSDSELYGSVDEYIFVFQIGYCIILNYNKERVVYYDFSKVIREIK